MNTKRRTTAGLAAVLLGCALSAGTASASSSDGPYLSPLGHRVHDQPDRGSDSGALPVPAAVDPRPSAPASGDGFGVTVLGLTGLAGLALGAAGAAGSVRLRHRSALVA
jgi:hypothetical protein